VQSSTGVRSGSDELRFSVPPTGRGTAAAGLAGRMVAGAFDLFAASEAIADVALAAYRPMVATAIISPTKRR